jgi:hypothetical protein
MRLISGAPFETPQETHGWNVQRVSPEKRNEIDDAPGVQVAGTYEGYLGKSHGVGLFHFPIFGGWKEYVVLETDTIQLWHLGWIVEGMGRSYFDLSRLTLREPRVRVLKPPAGTSVLFYAVDGSGVQVPLKLIGEGAIGDGKFPKVRLL